MYKLGAILIAVLLTTFSNESVAQDANDFCVVSKIVKADTQNDKLYRIWNLPSLGGPLLLYSPSWSSKVLNPDLKTSPFSPPSPFPSGPLGFVRYVVEPSGRVVGINREGVYLLNPGTNKFQQIRQLKGNRYISRVTHLENTGETLLMLENNWYQLIDETLKIWPFWQELKQAGVAEIYPPTYLKDLGAYVFQTRDTSKNRSSIYLKLRKQPVRFVYELDRVTTSMYLGETSASFYVDHSEQDVIGITKHEAFVFSITTNPISTVFGISRGSGKKIASDKIRPSFFASHLHRRLLIASRNSVDLPFLKKSSLRHYKDQRLQDVPGEPFKLADSSKLSVRDLRSIGKTVIWAEDGMWLYDGDSVQHVEGSGELGFTTDFVELPEERKVFLFERSGFFELDEHGRLAPIEAPFKTRFKENDGWHPEPVHWKNEGVIIFFAAEGIFVMDSTRKFTKLATHTIGKNIYSIDDTFELTKQGAILIRSRSKNGQRFIRISKKSLSGNLPCGYWQEK